MPHHSLQFTADGPIVDLVIGVSAARGAAIQKSGKVLPAPIQIRALVDTGASITAIDKTVVNALALTPLGATGVHTGSSGASAHRAFMYDVSIVIPHPSGSLRAPVVQVTELDLKPQGTQFLGLLGRDLLSVCLIIYDGRSGQFILSF